MSMRTGTANSNGQELATPYSSIDNRWIGWDLLSVVIIGVGIGWLLGLSVSPVVASIVAVVIAAAATLIATMGGWEKRESEPKKENSSNENRVEGAANPTNDFPPQNVDAQQAQPQSKQPILSRFTRIVTPLPFAMLMVGIVVGSIVGLYARNHSWFGSSLSHEVEQWTSQGLPKDEVVRRLFEREHPYTPYVQPWLRITSTMPISSTVSVTASKISATDLFSTEVQLWANAGLDKKEVITRLFSLKYPPYLVSSIDKVSLSTSDVNNAQPPVQQFDSVFYQFTKDQCDMLRRGINDAHYLSTALQAVNLSALLEIKDIDNQHMVIEKLLKDLSCPD